MALGKNRFWPRVRRGWWLALNSQARVCGGLRLKAGASPGVPGGSATVARILASCHRAAERSHTGPSGFSGGENQPSGAALAGQGLASCSFTVSLPLSELPAGSHPKAQGDHWLRGPQHEMGKGSYFLVGLGECHIHSWVWGHGGKALYPLRLLHGHPAPA